jgi:hypothetical protein
MANLRKARKLGFPFIPLTGISGSYLMLTEFAGTAWGFVSVASLAVVIAFTLAVTGPRLRAVGHAVAAGGPESPALQNLVHHPLLWVSVQTRAAVIVSMVVLKLIKPGVGGSLITIGLAILVGVLSALPMPILGRDGRIPAISAQDNQPATN